MVDDRQATAVRLLIASCCLYEVVALFTGLPTFTELVRRGLDHRWFRFLIWLGAGAAIDHFWHS